MHARQTEALEAFHIVDIVDIPGNTMRSATAIRSRRDDDVALIKLELTVIKLMIGFVLAFQVAMFANLFLD